MIYFAPNFLKKCSNLNFTAEGRIRAWSDKIMNARVRCRFFGYFKIKCSKESCGFRVPSVSFRTFAKNPIPILIHFTSNKSIDCGEILLKKVKNPYPCEVSYFLMQILRVNLSTFFSLSNYLRSKVIWILHPTLERMNDMVIVSDQIRMGPNIFNNPVHKNLQVVFQFFVTSNRRRNRFLRSYNRNNSRLVSNCINHS